MTKKTKPKEQLEFPDETTVDADFTKCRVFAVHKPLTGGKGYVVTHVKSHACVLRAEKKTDATAAAKALAFLFDRIDHGELRWLIEKLRFSVDESTDS